MSSPTTPCAAHYPDHVTTDADGQTTPPTLRGADTYPEHVKVALEALRQAQDEVDRAKKGHDDAVAKRNTALRDNYPMLRRHGLGPAAVERATGVGRSNVRFVTSGT